VGHACHRFRRESAGQYCYHFAFEVSQLDISPNVKDAVVLLVPPKFHQKNSVESSRYTGTRLSRQFEKK
jgi:hypothetical protein